MPDQTPPPPPRPVVPLAQAVPTAPPPPPPPMPMPMPMQVIPWAVQAPGADPAGAVLDYASPRKHAGRTRLPSRSKLEFQPGPDGRTFAVVESLAGKSTAITALAFGTVVLAVWAVQAGWYLRERNPQGFIFLAGWLGYAALVLAVINNTWRRTILAAGTGPESAPAGVTGISPGEAWMSLTFAAPFYRKAYRWRSDQVYDIRVVRMTTTPRTPAEAVLVLPPAPPLAELQIQTGTVPLVRLFTDHEERAIGWVYEGIRRAMNG